MKTKLSIDILKKTYRLEAFTKMIASHNEGIADLTIKDFESYFKCEKAHYNYIDEECLTKGNSFLLYNKENELLITITENPSIPKTEEKPIEENLPF